MRPIFSKLLDWLRPPRFADSEQTRVARLLHFIGLLLLSGALPHVWFNLGGNNRLMLAFLIHAVVLVWALIWNRRGRQNAASGLLIFSLTLVLAATVCLGHSGVRDVAVMGFTSTIVIAAILLRRWKFYALSAGVIVFVAVAGVAQVQGWMQEPPTEKLSYSYVVDMVSILAGVIVVAGFLADFLRQRLNAARNNAAALVLQTERLRASKEKFQSLLDLAADAFFLSDPSGKIVDVNRLAVEFTGYQKEELIGRPLQELLPATGSAHAAASGTDTSGIPGKLRRKDGQTLAVEVSSRVMPDAQVQAFVRDVSRRLELEAQLRQVQKMEAVGSLAGGVAHDFNNLLTAMQGHIDLLGMEQGLNPDMRESLAVLDDVTHRAAELTQQLLVFSRRQVLQISTLDVSVVIDELARLLRRTLRENIQLAWQPCPGRFWVEGDSSMLLQVLMNLAVNARDAMPDGGRLQITLEEGDAPAGVLSNSNNTAAGRFIRIAVTDTGRGIPPELLPRLGEPFFTTKEVGHGTGLGLATSYGIIQQHQGRIEVASTVGAGSTFTIYLPAVPSPAAMPEPKPAAPANATNSETILLVEDESAVRKLMTRVLEKHGFEVLAAGNGPAALDLWRAHHPRIRLLICDMIMPGGLNGHDVADHCRADNPVLPVVICSGYTPENMAGTRPADNSTSRLAKPFKPAELINAVRAHLDAGVAKN